MTKVSLRYAPRLLSAETTVGARPRLGFSRTISFRVLSIAPKGLRRYAVRTLPNSTVDFLSVSESIMRETVVEIIGPDSTSSLSEPFLAAPGEDVPGPSALGDSTG